MSTPLSIFPVFSKLATPDMFMSGELSNAGIKKSKIKIDVKG